MRTQQHTETTRNTHAHTHTQQQTHTHTHNTTKKSREEKNNPGQTHAHTHTQQQTLTQHNKKVRRTSAKVPSTRLSTSGAVTKTSSTSLSPFPSPKSLSLIPSSFLPLPSYSVASPPRTPSLPSVRHPRSRRRGRPFLRQHTPGPEAGNRTKNKVRSNTEPNRTKNKVRSKTP